jgi:hypothetical protein
MSFETGSSEKNCLTLTTLEMDDPRGLALLTVGVHRVARKQHPGKALEVAQPARQLHTFGS